MHHDPVGSAVRIKIHFGNQPCRVAIWDYKGSCVCECQVQTAQLGPDTPLQVWPTRWSMEQLPSASSREWMEVEWLKASPGLLGGGDCYGSVVVLSRSVTQDKVLSRKALNTELEFVMKLLLLFLNRVCKLGSFKVHLRTKVMRWP